MIVKLINFTPKPLQTVLFAYNMMKEKKIVSDLDKLSLEEATWITKQVVHDDLGGPLEYVSTVWLFDKASRAFQQQLTRHRTFGFSIQSMRIVDKKDFADKQGYLIPDDVVHAKYYEYAMDRIQAMYNNLIDKGELVQVARGILPLNIFSPISMVANMRNLLAMFKQRMCRQVQGEFKEAVVRMIKEIKTYMSPVFVEHLKEPCLLTNSCIMSTENELRIEGKDTLNRAPCPLYEKIRRNNA